MKRLWLLFSQVVTTLLAVWFVLVTLKPEWLNHRPSLSSLGLQTASVAGLNKDSSQVYKYLNFDQLAEYADTAKGVTV